MVADSASRIHPKDVHVFAQQLFADMQILDACATLAASTNTPRRVLKARRDLCRARLVLRLAFIPRERVETTVTPNCGSRDNACCHQVPTDTATYNL